MNNKNIAIWIIVVVLVLVGVVAIAKNQRNESINDVAIPTGTAAPSATPVSTPSATVSLSAVKDFNVAASNFKFSLNTITVKKGDIVRIHFKNNEGFHDWKVDEFNAATKQLQAGGEDTIQFVADKTGSFEYYCSVGTHRQMGMKGVLVVEA